MAQPETPRPVARDIGNVCLPDLRQPSGQRDRHAAPHESVAADLDDDAGDGEPGPAADWARPALRDGDRLSRGREPGALARPTCKSFYRSPARCVRSNP